MDGVHRSDEGPRSVVGRRVGTAFVAVVVILGAVGLLGDQVAIAENRQNGYLLAVTYAASARAGLDVPWTVTVENAAGLPQNIELAVTSEYFLMFEKQGFYPEPYSESTDGKWLYLAFNVPPGATRFVLKFDAYVQPNRQIGAAGTVAIMQDGAQIAPVNFSTFLLP